MSTKIEWTEETWNPVVGCSKVSDGCKYCYAIKMANRLAHIPAMTDLYMDTVTVGANGKPNWTGVVKVSEQSMDKPLRFKKATMFFVNSMSDLFHESVDFYIVDRVFAIMAMSPQHTFQILTKRPKRMVEYFERLKVVDGKLDMWFDGSVQQSIQWPLPNVWVGVSVENQKAADERVPLLLRVPASIRFLSCEPLLGPVRLAVDAPDDDDAGASRIYALTGRRTDMGRPCRDTSKIDWVITGGESGNGWGSRPTHPDWVRSLRDQCKADKVPFFFKQWGDWMPCSEGNDAVFPDGTTCKMKRVGKSKAGKKLDGKEHVEFPV